MRVSDFYAADNELRREGTHEVVGIFSSHWAAVAAMVRVNDPSFKSIGGDKPEDLAEEARIAAERSVAQ